MIFINYEIYGHYISVEPHVLPATSLSYADGLKVLAYINSTRSPTASISFKGTIIGNDQHAPFVAAFSSRGPNKASPGILKPDIIGPGVNILAAWHLSVEKNPSTKSNFNMISGTSMSCPHLSGIAALLKSVRPDLSPAAIKSAIMTTADVVNLARKRIEDERFLTAFPFATGSGHVSPGKATDPGLIYDNRPEDYVPYLCGLKYTNQQVEAITQRKVDCTSSIAEPQLNYPSFSIVFGPKIQTYSRTVTNVGKVPLGFYTANIVAPPGVSVIVNPSILLFTYWNQKLTYKITFTRLPEARDYTASEGSLTWTSLFVSVRSPIVATFTPTRILPLLPDQGSLLTN